MRKGRRVKTWYDVVAPDGWLWEGNNLVPKAGPAPVWRYFRVCESRTRMLRLVRRLNRTHGPILVERIWVRRASGGLVHWMWGCTSYATRPARLRFRKRQR